MNSATVGRTMLWLLIAVAIVFGPFANDAVPWLKSYPQEWVMPVTPLLNEFMTWFVAVFGFVFRGLSWLLTWPIAGVQKLLHWSPWVLTVTLCVVVAHAAQGWRLALFTAVAMFYMVAVGYWDESMNTLSLVAISVPLSVAVGFGTGVAAFVSPRAERIIAPSLDFLQTVPTFAYLLPVLLLFGFGPVTGLITSLIYAFSPMVRNTLLGLQRVAPEVIESGLMSGATPTQLFWQVRVPAASRQILLGVNQTTMAALSMVIVASIIGGTQDIGWEVLSTMRKAAFGNSLLAGLVIALMAMIMDRISWGLATRSVAPAGGRNFLARHPHFVAAAVLTAVSLILAEAWPVLRSYPRDWSIYATLAAPLNDGVAFVVTHFKTSIEGIKRVAFFFFMMPVRIGVVASARPMTWGFQWATIHSLIYLGGMGLVALYAVRRWSLMAGLAVAIWSAIFYFGLTNIPWPALIALFTALAWTTGGWRLGLGTLLGFVYLTTTGIWLDALLSIYLCGIAVLVSFVFGSMLGIWAAHDSRVSAVLRPINDTLQTMPLFVLLIPIVMIFKIGEFTALLAICAYAIVPAMRYAEHGLRNLPAEVIEAATAMGCTPRQLLLQVKLPLALPELMLGLNQTIMYGISMLVISALVGTKELGQRVYIGLSDGDFGVGIIAGIGMAVLAMIADRMTQSWSARKRVELGLA